LNLLIVIIGVIKKQSFWFYYVKFKIKIISDKRIEFYHLLTNQLSDVLVLDSSTKAESLSNSSFNITNKTTKINFMVESESSKQIVTIINKLCAS